MKDVFQIQLTIEELQALSVALMLASRDHPFINPPDIGQRYQEYLNQVDPRCIANLGLRLSKIIFVSDRERGSV